MHAFTQQQPVSATPLDVWGQDTEPAGAAQPEDGRPRDRDPEDLEHRLPQDQVVGRRHGGAPEAHRQRRTQAGAERQLAGAIELGAYGDATEPHCLARQVERRFVDVNVAHNLECLCPGVEAHLVGSERYRRG